MGLTDEKLWGLSLREYHALIKVWKQHQQIHARFIAAIRSDLYNTAGKAYKDDFTVDQFLGESVESGVDARARQLMAMGYAPAAAAAIASSKQSDTQKIHMIDSALRAAEEKQKYPKQRRRA